MSNLQGLGAGIGSAGSSYNTGATGGNNSQFSDPNYWGGWANLANALGGTVNTWVTAFDPNQRQLQQQYQQQQIQQQNNTVLWIGGGFLVLLMLVVIALLIRKK